MPENKRSSGVWDAKESALLLIEYQPGVMTFVRSVREIDGSKMDSWANLDDSHISEEAQANSTNLKRRANA